MELELQVAMTATMMITAILCLMHSTTSSDFPRWVAMVIFCSLWLLIAVAGVCVLINIWT